jgi:hypothetical protein
MQTGVLRFQTNQMGLTDVRLFLAVGIQANVQRDSDKSFFIKTLSALLDAIRFNQAQIF